MIAFNKSFRKKLLAVLLASMIMLTACKKDEDGGIPPSLPPSSSMELDFSYFPSDQKSADQLKTLMLTQQNFGKAAVTVFVWNTILSVYMAIPVASYIKAFENGPVYKGDNTWLWSYSVVVFGQTIQAELTGTIQGPVVIWQMNLTPESTGVKFLWYSGQCNIQGTEGYWIINKDENKDNIPEEAIRIDWDKLITDETASVTFTNIIYGDEEYESYISFGIDQSLDLNAFYDIYSKSVDNLVEIEWNTETHEGRVKDPDGYGDTDWHCWDELLNDITCN